jgi:two-component system cell cycle sensor histidine kinase/response regulator CckA
VRLRVSDTGTGMATHVVEHAFDPFFTTKSVGEGTGLGLATVYGIITKSGGHAHFYSEPSVGTTFVALFPALDAPPAAEDHQPVAAVSSEATILVVEDEQALLSVTRRILEDAGYRVLTAAGGPEALAALAADGEPVDLLLSDVVMPEMLGPELASYLRERKPSIRVLFMSGFAQPVLGEAIEMGTVEMIEKPFTGPALLRRVAQALSHA